MEYLKRSPKINRLIFGCNAITTNPTSVKANKVLRAAFSYGIDKFDTAPSYGMGYSELILGENFKNSKDVYITTKVGEYNPKNIFLPSSISLPINYVSKNCLSIKNKLTKKINNESEPNCNQNKFFELNTRLFLKHVKNSKKRLKRKSLDCLLLHEVNPFSLSKIKINMIKNLLSSKQVKEFGYGGHLYEDLLSKNLPSWINVMQFRFPYEDKIQQKKIIKFISKNPGIRIRLFGLFSSGKSLYNFKIARELLSNFPNTFILFHTNKISRLEENIKNLVE